MVANHGRLEGAMVAVIQDCLVDFIKLVDEVSNRIMRFLNEPHIEGQATSKLTEPHFPFVWRGAKPRQSYVSDGSWAGCMSHTNSARPLTHATFVSRRQLQKGQMEFARQRSSPHAAATCPVGLVPPGRASGEASSHIPHPRPH